MQLMTVFRILWSLSVISFTQLPSFADDVETSYILGPGDVLSITDKEGTLAIPEIRGDGTAVINNAEVIKAAGLTVNQFRDAVNEKALKSFPSSNVEVKLERRKPQVATAAAKTGGEYVDTILDGSPFADLSGSDKSAFKIIAFKFRLLDLNSTALFAQR